MRSASRKFLLGLLYSYAAAASAQEMMRVSRMVMAQQIIESPAAEYPADAKAAGVEGTVVLDVVISKTGAVEQVFPVSGPDKLRDAAKAAVSKWTYKPYLLDDVPTEVGTMVRVEFSLKGGLNGEPMVKNASGDAGDVVTKSSVAPSAVAASPSIAPLVKRLSISPGVAAGLALHHEPPKYPAEARAQHVSGRVILHAVISKSGTITNLEVDSGDYLLRQAAVEAIKKWTYKPFLLNGEPIEVQTMIEVNFNYNTSQPTLTGPSQTRPGGAQPAIYNPSGPH